MTIYFHKHVRYVCEVALGQVFNDVALGDCQAASVNHIGDALHRLLWKGLPCMYQLLMSCKDPYHYYVLDTLSSIGHLLQAMSILDSINDEEVRYKPAVLATRLTLQEQQQDLAGAVRSAQEGLQWWQASMTADKSQKVAAQTWILQQLVHLQLKTGKSALVFVACCCLARICSSWCICSSKQVGAHCCLLPAVALHGSATGGSSAV